MQLGIKNSQELYANDGAFIFDTVFTVVTAFIV